MTYMQKPPTNEKTAPDNSAEYIDPYDTPQTPADSSPRNRHVGTSNYSKKKIQPYDIWIEYQLNPWDADIIKRILRTKVVHGQEANTTRIEDYQKVIHICQTRIAQIQDGDPYNREKD